MQPRLIFFFATSFIIAVAIFNYRSILSPTAQDTIKWTNSEIKAELSAGHVDPEFQKYFDRDPDRTVPDEKNIVVSPADGVVSSVERTTDSVTIITHLSLFDVHVQRLPISGTVVKIEHVGNGYYSAKDPEYLNGVQTVTTLATVIGQVKIRQITALFTTRIQTYPKVGDKVTIGDRLGRILLGSTVVLVLSPQVTVTAKAGDYVYGAETIVARY